MLAVVKSGFHWASTVLIVHSPDCTFQSAEFPLEN